VSNRKRFSALAAAIDDERRRLLAAGGAPAGELGRLALEEIWASTRLAGAGLAPGEVAALLERAVVMGERRLDEYVLVADYAAAAAFAAAAPPIGRRHIFLRLEEIIALHELATGRQPAARPGQWRTTTAAPFSSGVVPPPAWLVPREMNAFVERVALGPAAHVHALEWIAGAHERFARIHPFAKGNGRVVRLMTNLLLQRSGLPPFAVRGGAGTYLAALRRADARDLWPLGSVLARAVLGSLRRLVAATEPNPDLRSLASFASGAARARLYKAAQRGRLRSVRRGGTLLTSAAWIAEYEASRA